MAEELQRPYKGLYMDSSFVDQPKETYSYALNAVSESLEGDANKLSFENSNELLTSFPADTILLNSTYIGENTFAVFIKTLTSSIIGTLNVDKKSYVEHVNFQELDFQLGNPIQATYRLRRGCEKTIYFTDNYNVPRYYNFASKEDFKSNGDWDVNKFGLIKTYNKIPKYKKIEVVEGGSLKAGSYNFAFQYLDNDLNPTEWLNVSDTIIIFHDNEKEMSYQAVRGSTNKKTSYQDFGPTTKAIKLEIDNLDQNYTFYRIAIIEATSGTGQVSSVLYSQELSTKQPAYTFTGTNGLIEGLEEEISLFQSDVRKAESILQLENTLVLGNTKGLGSNLCKLQKYASKIKSNLSTKEVILNSTKFTNNHKNPQIHMFTGSIEQDSLGYMPGEIYSFGIVYVFKGGLSSPVYHIPGIDVDNSINLMSVDNKLLTTTYQDNEICEGELGYWGVDSDGDTLAGKSVRHHRFPTRLELSEKTGDNYSIKKSTLDGTVEQYTLLITDYYPASDQGNDDAMRAGSTVFMNVEYTFEGERNTTYKKLITVDLSRYNPPYDVAFENLEVVTSTKKPIYIGNEINYLDPGGNGSTTFSFKNVLSDLKITSTNQGDVIKNYLTLTWPATEATEFVTYELKYTIGGESKIARGNINLAQSTIITIDSSTEPIVFTSFNEVQIIPTGEDAGEYEPIDPQSGTVYDINVETKSVTVEGEYDVTEVFGITFDNIVIPTKEQIGEEIVGYYIVQNKRDEDNKTILDTGLMLPVIDTGEKFQGVGLLSPDGDSSNVTDITGSLDSKYVADALTPAVKNKYALFHPENAFNNKEYSDAKLEYNCSYKMEEGIVKQNLDIQDVQPGTSYNSERHKKRERDTDGFTLQVLSRKFVATGVSYKFNPYGAGTTIGGVVGFRDFIPDTERIDYLNSLHSYTKTEGEDLKEVFNLSTDNRFAVVTCNTDMPEVETKLHNNLTKSEPYIKNNFYKHVVTLKRTLSDPYANYRSTPYYKASKNIHSVESSQVTIFAGDSYISPVTLTSSIFSDVRNPKRASKGGLFKVLLGVVIVVGAILAAPLSGGASILGGAALLSTAAAVTAVGLGITLAATGLKVEKMREVYEDLYEQGLKNVVHDFTTKKFFGPDPADDSIQWFSDVLENVYLESSVNMNWRVGTSGQIPDFADSPKNYSINFHNDRLIDKLTILDPERDAGRLYQGFCNAELYEVNKDYERRQEQKPFFHLPIEYDCCTDCPEQFRNRIVWSEQSFQEELTDNYRSFLPMNYKDIQGESGEITALHTIQENFYVHTKEGLWNLPKNYQERVTDQIVSFIGTGSLFAIPPRKIVDSISGNNAGSQHQRGSIKTPYGIVFVSENEKAIYLFNGNNLQPLHAKGLNNWFKNNLNMRMLDLFQEKSQLDFPLRDNPFSKYGTGYILGYDSRKQRVLITKKDYIIKNHSILLAKDLYLGFEGDQVYFLGNLQEKIDELNFEQELKYKIKSAVGSTIVLTRDLLVDGNYIVDTTTIETEPINLVVIDNSWTISYNLKKQEWESFLGYQPNMYLTSGDEFYTYKSGTNNIWKHNIKGKFNNFYGVNHETVVEFVKQNSAETRVLNSINLYTEAFKYDNDTQEYYLLEEKTYNKAVFYNSKQCSGLLTLLPKSNEEESWFSDGNQLQNVGEILIDKNEKDWSINDIRDIRIDYTKPIWTKKDIDLKGENAIPFIDKVLNEATLDFNKDWDQLESLRDKYLVVRLIFDNFDDVNIFLNYSYTNESVSKS